MDLDDGELGILSGIPQALVHRQVCLEDPIACDGSQARLCYTISISLLTQPCYTPHWSFSQYGTPSLKLRSGIHSREVECFLFEEMQAITMYFAGLQSAYGIDHFACLYNAATSGVLVCATDRYATIPNERKSFSESQAQSHVSEPNAIVITR